MRQKSGLEGLDLADTAGRPDPPGEGQSLVCGGGAVVDLALSEEAFGFVGEEDGAGFVAGCGQEGDALGDLVVGGAGASA
ncbi:hypothetical protein [Kitasatospora sp. NPDC007106]|uniref:hypothetical protein n=1 Tax=Kitasatospora sp. NPDC007106 TaxID=3156914 RepID=UPI0033D82B99